MKEKTARWVADRLPRLIVYFALIRAWVNATTGQWSDQDIGKVTADEMCERWEKTTS